jgi:hypothetical protein
VRQALAARGLDTAGAEADRSLNILSAKETYRVRGDFDPETAIATFNTAIDQALTDGFTGFRAAANMAWALELERGPELLITYEALLRSLFSNAVATGLCLYPRDRMPVAVLDGALCTHPIVRANEGWATNQFYDPSVRSLRPVVGPAVIAKLQTLDSPGGHARPVAGGDAKA